MPDIQQLIKRFRDECPDREQVYAMFLHLLPRGKAWQSNDASITHTSSVMQAFWYGISGPWTELEALICQSIDELYCMTTVKNVDAWDEEYGLPNDCSPLGDDLCGYVAAVGGTSAAYYVDIAQRAGWIIIARWLRGGDTEFPGVRSTLRVTVDKLASPSYHAPGHLGIWTLGNTRFGETNTSDLECILDTIVPAHCEILYEVI